MSLGLNALIAGCTGDIVRDPMEGAVGPLEGSPDSAGPDPGSLPMPAVPGAPDPTRGMLGDPPLAAPSSMPPTPTAQPVEPTQAGPQRDPSGARVPERLSQTGLYSDISSRTVAPGRRFYIPRYELWSDDAEKSRWVYLPPGTQIDNTDRNHWSFPVGTQVWKEFKVGGRAIETRLIQRVGPGRDEYMYATYQWREDGSDADYVASGVPNAAGTGHDIPSHAGCLSCHTHLPEHVLGFSALLLSHQLDGVNLRMLDAERLLVAPEPNDLHVPGDPLAQEALGYLHSNCGSCHNQPADAQAPLTGVQLPNRFSLRVAVDASTVGDTDACQTSLNVPMSYATPSSDIVTRLIGGGPERSGLYHRTALRGATQMPPLATKVVDTAGIQLLSRWIAVLPGPTQAGCASLR